MRLFHGTSRAALQRIQADGYLAQPYLTTCPDQANYYAACAAEDHDGEPCVLVVELDDALLHVDRTAYDAPLTFFRDHWATSDREWHEGLQSGEIPCPANDRDIATALQITHSLRASMDLPAGHILTVAPAATIELLEPAPAEESPCPAF